MLELTTANALDFLRDKGWLPPGPAQVELLGGGVSNVVLRVQTPNQRMVLKQARPQLRTRDPWFSDLDRVNREQEVMQALFPLLPALTVPEILYTDRENYVFAMTHAPAEAKVWKTTLLTGQVDIAVGKQAGLTLGQIHERTARNPNMVDQVRDRTVFVQLRVEPFYQRIQERRPEVARAVEGIVAGMMSTHQALCHGDYSPKNILVHEKGFTLVDYETAHYGDPAMDLGFFLSHLLLKAIKLPALREKFAELTRAFWQAYAPVVAFCPVHELQARAIAHCAVCALARIDGTSPVDYLPEELKRECVRRVGRRILWERPEKWDDVLAICETEIAGM
jgi:5-methylthioribose kinase